MRNYYRREFLDSGEMEALKRIENLIRQGRLSLHVSLKTSLLRVLSNHPTVKNLNPEKGEKSVDVLCRLVAERGGHSIENVKGVVWEEPIDIALFPFDGDWLKPILTRESAAIYVNRRGTQRSILATISSFIGMQTFFYDSMGQDALVSSGKVDIHSATSDFLNEVEASCVVGAKVSFPKTEGYRVLFETQLGAIIHPSQDGGRHKHPVVNASYRNSGGEEVGEKRALKNRSVDVAIYDEEQNVVVAVLEFDGVTHKKQDQIEKDGLRDRMLLSAEMPLLRISLSVQNGMAGMKMGVVSNIISSVCHDIKNRSSVPDRGFSKVSAELIEGGRSELDVLLATASIFSDSRRYEEQRDEDVHLWLMDLHNLIRKIEDRYRIEINCEPGQRSREYNYKVEYRSLRDSRSGLISIGIQAHNIYSDIDFLLGEARYRKLQEDGARLGSLYRVDSRALNAEYVSPKHPVYHYGLVPRILVISVLEFLVGEGSVG